MYGSVEPKNEVATVPKQRWLDNANVAERRGGQGGVQEA